MRLRHPRVIALAAVAGCLVGCARPQPPADPADVVLLNGRVLTVDPQDSVAEAVAIDNGKVVAVGTSIAIRRLVGTETEVIDLAGRAATPGLIDSHVHFSAVAELYSVNLSDAGVKSMADVLSRVAARVATTKPGEWVRGSGWDEGKLAEKRYVTAADLDSVAPNNPVWLTQTTGHYGVANTAAMTLAGVSRDTKDPPAGTIDRDERGNPTGVMKESAQGLITSKIPPFTREQQKAGLLKIIEEFNKEGMTGAKDPGIGEEKWELYQELLKEGKLNVRVFALWSGGRSYEAVNETLGRLQRLGPARSQGDGRLALGGVKLFMDGSGGARTAWMHEEWHKNSSEIDHGNVGYPAIEPDEYYDAVSVLHRAGVHISTHAIGDRAIDWVVDVYDQVLADTPSDGLRHGIIHVNSPTDHAIETMARLQRDYDAAYPEAQATFLWWLGDNYAGNLGPERAGRLKPFKTFLNKGVKWAGGSDYTVTPFAARYSLWAALARETLNGTYGKTPFGTAEAIDIKTALRSQTLWAAHQMFLDKRVGSIEVGKDADIAVWDRDLYAVPAAQIKDLQCELTILAGRVVYHREGSPVSVTSAPTN